MLVNTRPKFHMIHKGLVWWSAFRFIWTSPKV